MRHLYRRLSLPRWNLTPSFFTRDTHLWTFPIPDASYCSLPAAHQSGHNSGVIHSGIYYSPGSLKAKLCVEGLDLTYKYCIQRKIHFKRCGKLIVARNDKELESLDALYKRAVMNEVKDVTLISKDKIKEIEPHIQGLKAIWAPNTGIVDWAEVTRAFVQDCCERGADLFLDFCVKEFQPFNESSDKLISVNSTKRNVISKWVVTCGGLHADMLALMTKCSPEPKIIPFRGEYLVLKPEKSHLVKTNIYPVPHPGLPFLGVHITPRLDGSVWLGPNAVLVFNREGYKRWSYTEVDFIDFMSYRGLRKLMRRHFRFGLGELYRSFNMSAQVKVLQEYMPTLQTSWVERGPSGVRAQALDLDGNLVDDFIFDSGSAEFEKHVLHVRNAPSPAATSSLAIAKVIADKMEEEFSIRSSMR